MLPTEELEIYKIRNKGKDMWKDISRFEPISIHFIRLYKNRIDFDKLSYNSNVKLETLLEFKDHVNWGNILYMGYIDVPESFIINNFHFFQKCVSRILMSPKQLSEELIDYLLTIDGITFSDFFISQKISAEFIKNNLNKVDEGCIMNLFKNANYSIQEKVDLVQIYLQYKDLL